MYAIGLCFDENYLLPGLVTIMSVASSTTASDRKSIAIRIIANDLTKTHAQFIAAFANALGFGSFDLTWRRLEDRYHIVQGVGSRGIRAGDHITLATYLRYYFCPDFVDRPHLIYLDSDLLVLEDISSPFNSVGVSQLGAVQDELCSTVSECYTRLGALPGFADDFPSFSERPYFNAGAFWLDTNLMPRIKNGIDNVMAGPASRYVFYNDQDAINMWLLKRNHAFQLPGHLNRFELGRTLEQSDWARGVVDVERSRHTSVLHFIGRLKPWLRRCPTTPGVRLYRLQLSETQKLLRKLGIQTIAVRG
jgi:lipopolysaccharide biosynthesis glycosyltransferase